MNRIAIVTGGTSGIGLETVRLLTSEKDKVYVIAKTEDNKVDNYYACDISNAEQVKTIIDEIGEKEGHIDIVVNCAGYGISGAVELTPESQAQSIFNVNVLGTFYVNKYALKYMKEGSKIVNIASACALYPVPFRAFYCATKSAVQMLSFGLYMELMDNKIDVCSVCPGEVKTNFTKNRIKNFETSPRYGDKIQNAAHYIDKNDGKRMSPIVVAQKIVNQINKSHMKPMIIISKKYKVLNFISRFVSQKTMLKLTNKLLGGKNK